MNAEENRTKTINVKDGKQNTMSVEEGGRKKKKKGGSFFMTVVFLFLLAAMTVHVYQLYQKRESYLAVEEERKAELAEQEKRQEELVEYEAYTRSDEYVEDMAQARLGMVYGDEIIFREKK